MISLSQNEISCESLYESFIKLIIRFCVSAHVLSPLSKGLFKRAIIQSGAMIFNKDIPPVSISEGLAAAKKLAKDVNCTEDKTWLSCLRKVDAGRIIKSFLAPFWDTM